MSAVTSAAVPGLDAGRYRLEGEADMSSHEVAPKDVNTVTGKSFSSMTGAEKLRHVGKVVVFLLSFGFIFPNIFSD